MLPDDDDLIPFFSVADVSAAAEEGAASAEAADGQAVAGAAPGAAAEHGISSHLPALDIAELIPDLADGSEGGEAVDLSALFDEDVAGGESGASVEIADVGAGDSFAVPLPAALPGLDDIPGDGGFF